MQDLVSEAAQLDAGVDASATSADVAAPGDAVPKIPTADFLAGMLMPVFDTMAPNWKVRPSEVKMLATGWAAVLDHYWPGGVGEWGPWGMALGATVSVIGPRILIPPQLPASPSTASSAAPATPAA